MSGGGLRSQTRKQCAFGSLLPLVLALLCPSGLDGAVNCPQSVDRDCICDTRKGQNHRGGWEIFCTEDNYRIEYSIRSFVKLECSRDQTPPYSRAMFHKYNLTDVDNFQFVTCALPTNLTMDEVLEGVQVKKLKYEGDMDGTYFDSSTFGGLTSLLSLDLKTNKLESVPGDFLSNLTQLKYIGLNDNSLKVLPETLFQNLGNLVKIELGSNQLQELPSGIFANLTKLQQLYLYKNQLRELPAGIFLGLKSLTLLELASNQIQELHHEMFLDTPQMKHLSVRGNNLTRLQSDLLHGLKHLEELDASYNKLPKLPENLLDGLNSLQKITLRSCNIKAIGEDFFSYATNLTTINLFDNRLTSLPPGLFRNNIGLKELILQYNDLMELPSNIFDRNANLLNLKITHNSLTSLPAGVLDHLSNLAYLDLSANQLTSLSGNLFSQTQKLEELYVAKNQLTQLEGGQPFGESSVLKVVDFSDNQIKSISAWINWSIYLKLEKINFNNNNVTYLNMSDFSYFPGAKVELKSNKIRHVNVESLKQDETSQSNPPSNTMKIDLEDNPFNCDCNLLSFVNYAKHKSFKKAVEFTDLRELECQEPSNFSGTKLTAVNPKDFICQETEDCPWGCYCIKRAFDKETIVNCSFQTELPNTLPPGTTIVHLEDNQIENLDALESNIWKNVTKLYLDRNNITVGDWNLPVNLKQLSLKGNQLEYLPQSFIDYVESHPNIELYLGNNPWFCDCETLHLKDWLYENKDKIKDLNDMYCSNLVFQNGSEVRTSIGRLTEEVCPEENLVNNSYLIMVSVTCVILAILLFIVSVLYYRNKQTVIAYIYIHFHNAFVCFFNDDDLDEDKTFDAFVSYSSADRDVALELVRNLENGDPNFKLCIHERDWLPGNLISWNIVNSVQNSRKTILVLSKHFVESVWFQVEFHTAYYQMLEDRIDRLIVIVRGDLPDKNAIDKDLQYLLSTKTFLEWEERWFWEKLRYALPHRRPTSNGIAAKSALQDKNFPLRQRPNPGLLKTVEEKIATVSDGNIFSKRNDNSRSGDVQLNVTPDNKNVKNGDVQLNFTTALDNACFDSEEVQTSDGPKTAVDSTPNIQNGPANGFPQVSAVQINGTKAQSRRFNSAKANASQNGLENGHSRDATQQALPV